MRRTAIVAAVRTPVGRIRGTLSEVPAHRMAALVIGEAVRRAGIDPAIVDEVIYGNLYAHDISNMARYAALEGGLPITVPAITVDRRCGTSLTAISLADALIRAGDAECVLAGGVESDSNRPYVLMQQNRLHNINAPVFRGKTMLAPDEIGNPPMGMTAENLADKYGITRRDCDAFAVESHRKAVQAWDSGYFREQIVPVTVADAKKGTQNRVDADSVFRRDCTMETLAKLKPAFRPNGVSTAGNSSPNSDGASAVILMEESVARSQNCPILGYINGFTSVGVDPNIMGIGPVYATRKLLKKTGLTLADMDVIEMNEAFAAQSLACIKELDMDVAKLNPNGGAIALGHPLAATGGILVTKMVYELQRRGASRGLVTFCCGGGQGVSLIVERE
ncbi:thiolase family protein [Flavonifractor sp. HCP28S3_F3]|uniref:thiolase family protein n=1 Tax=Flavonifractor sp. HCP28S3_F3 TaxID=3438939 RepID=UPI003F8C5140